MISSLSRRVLLWGCPCATGGTSHPHPLWPPPSQAQSRLSCQKKQQRTGSTNQRLAIRAAADVAIEAAQAEPEPKKLLSSDLGANLDTSGTCSFSVWAPHASQADVAFIRTGRGASTKGNGQPGADTEPEIIPMAAREGNIWAVQVDNVKAGDKYWFILTQGGQEHRRRDARARATEYKTDTCFVVDPTYDWSPFQTPKFHELNIYQLHVGAFTGRLEGGGTFAALEQKLQHISDLGFTAIQMLPVHEYCGSWGYNPRLLFSIHPYYGSPQELRRLVDAAHQQGLAVIFDLVLNHGAANLNSLWAYDGFNDGNRGGIYFDGGTDTSWGRTFAWWQKEVKDMVIDAARMFLTEFNGDGLRFDCVHAMPWDLLQKLTWTLRDEHPGKILISEITPEKPDVIKGAGFDATWMHSSYYDMRAFMKERRSPRKLQSLLNLHPGYTTPTNCIKYFLGSHDQLGCRKNGGYDDDIQGYHRYAVEMFGGRDNWDARAMARMWYAAQVVCQGIPMTFMGTEWHHSKWWGVDKDHNLRWELQDDEVGRAMSTMVRDANRLRMWSEALQIGSLEITHLNNDKCIIAFVRKTENDVRLVVMNASSSQWEKPEYAVEVGRCFKDGDRFVQVFNSQAKAYGGWEGSGNENQELVVNHGKISINLPKWAVLTFRPA